MGVQHLGSQPGRVRVCVHVHACACVFCPKMHLTNLLTCPFSTTSQGPSVFCTVTSVQFQNFLIAPRGNPAPTRSRPRPAPAPTGPLPASGCACAAPVSEVGPSRWPLCPQGPAGRGLRPPPWLPGARVALRRLQTSWGGGLRGGAAFRTAQPPSPTLVSHHLSAQRLSLCAGSRRCSPGHAQAALSGRHPGAPCGGWALASSAPGSGIPTQPCMAGSGA